MDQHMFFLVTSQFFAGIAGVLLILESMSVGRCLVYRLQRGRYLYKEGDALSQEGATFKASSHLMRALETFPLVSRYRQRAEEDLLRTQVPSALETLAGAVGSGLSLVQAFERVVAEAEDPLKTTFALIPEGVAAGMSLRAALVRLQEAFPSEELRTLFIAIELHHRTGGDLGALLTRNAQAQRESNELRQELEVKTTQARFSAQVVGVLPIALLGVLTLFSTDYITAFFNSLTGVIILLVAIVMEVAGYLLVKRAAEVQIT